MPLSLYLLEFSKGYHVGWRKPHTIIDHHTVLRALASVAYMTGDTSVAEAIASGKVRASALYPALPREDSSARLLVGLPHLPALRRASKLGISWATLRASLEILSHASRCTESGGRPYLSGRRGEPLIECWRPEAGMSSLKLGLRSDVACLPGPDCNSLAEAGVGFEKIEEHHNRIDRVTGAADLYRLSGWRPLNPLWLAVEAPNRVLDHIGGLLEVLGELGIGAYRSRGWGHFTLNDGVVAHGLDGEVLSQHTHWTRGAYNLLLGSIPHGEWIDPSRSFANSRMLMGISGPPYEEYKLPVVSLVGPCSVVFARNEPTPWVRQVSTSNPALRAILVFNPLVVSKP